MSLKCQNSFCKQIIENPKRSWTKFCSTKCRVAAHRHEKDKWAPDYQEEPVVTNHGDDLYPWDEHR